MNITRENLGELEFQLKVEVAASDYQENMQKQLKAYRQKATLPGFRKGTAPMGLITKMYGSAVKADEVQNVAAEAVFNYIKSENLNTVGNPMSNVEKTGEVDFEKNNDFTFYFDCALMPQMNPKWEAVKEPLYQTKVSPKEAEKQIEQLCERYGKFETPEVVGEGNILYGKAVELDKNGEVKEGGKTVYMNFNINQLKDDAEVRALFFGKKVTENVRFAANKAFTPSELQQVMHLEEAEAKKFKSEMEFTLTGISNIVPHEQNEEFYNMVLPGEDIKDAAAFKKAIIKETEKANNEQCKLFYINQVRKALVEASDDVIPEAYLKRMILANKGEEPLTAEELDEQWAENYLPSIKWEFLTLAFEKIKPLRPTHNDMVEHIKGILSAMPMGEDVDAAEREKAIQEQAETIAKDSNTTSQIEDKLYSDNLFNFFNEQLKPETEKLTIKELAEKLK